SDLILVVDGSPDNSLKICKFYEQKDSRVSVLEKENGGLSDARNAGFNIARGNYIWFIDGDDYIENKSLDSFFSQIKNKTDIFLFNYQEVYPDKIIQYNKFNKEFSINGLELIKKYNNYGIQAWTQIYSKSFLKNFNIKFEKGAIY